MAKKESSEAELKSLLLSLLGIHAQQWSLGRLISEPAPVSVPVWGLFVTEEDGCLHFISFDQDNWFSALKKSGSTPGQKPSNGIKLHLSFPFSERKSLEIVKKKGFLSFLQRSFPTYHLIQNTSENKIIFELEDPCEEFLTALRINSI